MTKIEGIEPVAWTTHANLDALIHGQNDLLMTWKNNENLGNVPLYTADQLRAAQVKALRDAANNNNPVCGLVEQRMLRRMADELEAGK